MMTPITTFIFFYFLQMWFCLLYFMPLASIILNIWTLDPLSILIILNIWTLDLLSILISFKS